MIPNCKQTQMVDTERPNYRQTSRNEPFLDVSSVCGVKTSSVSGGRETERDLTSNGQR